MRTLRRRRSWLLPKVQLSLILVLLGLLAAATPANADTTYSFQGVTLRKFQGNFGYIPECDCTGQLFDGEEVGAITGEAIFDDSTGQIKSWWLSFNGSTMRSDDPTYSACCYMDINRLNGEIVSWNIALGRVYPGTTQSVMGGDALTIYTCNGAIQNTP